MPPKTIKDVPENQEEPKKQVQDQDTPMPDANATGNGETSSTTPQDTHQEQVQDAQDPPVSSGSSTSTSIVKYMDEEEKLRQALADASAARFLQDGASTEVRQSRKRHFDECLEDLKAYQAAKQALRPATEREVVLKDMPALQLRGGPVRFDDRAMHESISAFFYCFRSPTT
ncbi:hypothetical protein LRAMOSA02298 [Lichtheimia ramosa]|uniref:Uncharacterized protein n=1 Tax=Lichtheimia ramosa TaxID=688394 RepID=A0A077WLJ8_9FUNG|nr:hypothetical protein LRAMOSA02298 [Lichtheimia ramosa]